MGFVVEPRPETFTSSDKMTDIFQTPTQTIQSPQSGAAALPKNPWARPSENVLEELHVSAERGLDAAEVQRRRELYGPNRLKEIKRRSPWLILANQFKSLIVLLLVVAGGLSFAFGDWIEGVAIVVVIFINAAIGFGTELKGARSIEALRKLGGVSAKVRREGQMQEIPAEELVPGDIVILEGGDMITADIRLLQASKLQADESLLTGESLPVSKGIEPTEADAPLAERTNMLFKGTALTRGSGEGVVVATGMATELGQISSLVEEVEEETTPLERRLNQLGHKLIWATLGIAAAIAVSGIIEGKEFLLMIETSIALAVAAIPEGLPVVATIALARGIWRMARRNALVNRLSAVETIGAIDVICTDKTGTLTENRLTVARLALDSGDVEVSTKSSETEGEFTRDGEPVVLSREKVLREALEVGVLCSNASLHREESGANNRAVGDPLEIALLVAGAKAGLDREGLLKTLPEMREEAFDSDIKMMATFHEDGYGYRVAVKGAPEPVLEACSSTLTEDGEKELTDEGRRHWLERNHRMAESGLRVLAVARKNVEALDAEAYEGLTLLGLVGMLDPPRLDVHPAIESCQKAGINVVMVTGDQPVTARNIGLAVGLVEEDDAEVIHGRELKGPAESSEEDRQRFLRANLFARVSPRQKLDLIDIHQKNGSIVAMTGDGVNDAPALKKADIGIAMGQRGTQVACEAADMVLKDDAFSTIAAAIEQGRVIFNNIRRFVFFLISCNVSEIMIVGLGSLVNVPLPVLPLQILFINLVTDVFPALALGVSEGDPAIMRRPPRDPREPVLTRRHWLAIAGYGPIMTLSVLGALVVALVWFDMTEREAVTVSFLTLAFAQLWHVFNMRDPGSRLFRNDITRNPFIWGALALCSGLLVGAVYVPALAYVLKVVDPGIKGWILVIVMSLVPCIVGQVAKSIRRG